MNSVSPSDNASAAPSPSAIARHLSQLAGTSEVKPTSHIEYLRRMERLPHLAGREAGSNGFASPVNFNAADLRAVAGMQSAHMTKGRFLKDPDAPVSLYREAVLITMEAKPRPLSFGINGYQPSDFFAYIYQDVILKSMPDAPAHGMPFEGLLDRLKLWLRTPPPRGNNENPARQIRRRLMALLNRTANQVNALLDDREIPTEMIPMLHKLLERDDDVGYTRGDIRDFQAVRDDFNQLVEHCARSRYKLAGDVKMLKMLDAAACPAQKQRTQASQALTPTQHV